MKRQKAQQLLLRWYEQLVFCYEKELTPAEKAYRPAVERKQAAKPRTTRNFRTLVAFLDTPTLDVARAAGARYELSIWNSGEVASAEGAQLRNGKLLVQIRAGDSELNLHEKSTLHFNGKR